MAPAISKKLIQKVRINPAEINLLINVGHHLLTWPSVKPSGILASSIWQLGPPEAVGLERSRG